MATHIPCFPDTVEIRTALEEMPLLELLAVYTNWAHRLIPPRPSLPEFLAAHTALVRGNVELTLENSQRLVELSMTVIKEATGNVAGRESTPARHKRAA